MRRPHALATVLVMLLACGDDDAGGRPDVGVHGDDGGTPPDAGGRDAQSDSDAGRDASVPEDAGTDAGPIGSPGCVDGDLAEGDHTFVLDGMERRFRVHLPSGYTSERAWPVVFALHGNGGSIDTWRRDDGHRTDIRTPLRDHAILILTEAIDGRWRDYDMPRETWEPRIVLELAYFEELITRTREGLCVNDDGIFAMGFSGGGSFSGLLGCRRTDIRAIAVGGSVMYFDPVAEPCVGQPAAWITIGTEELNDGRARYRDFFRDLAGCSETTIATDPDPCVAYEGCDEGTPVHYCQHPDGHIWPAFGGAAMWDFFSQFVE